MPQVITSESDVWTAILGDEHGGPFRAMLLLLYTFPPKVLQDAIDRINRETSIGPMLNPTAYLDNTRFNNAREYIDVLEAAIKLRRLLP